jgi:hypothetical protein
MEIDADAEVAYVTQASGVPSDVARDILNAYYDVVHIHPNPDRHYTEIQARTGQTRETVIRVFDAQLRFLQAWGIAVRTDENDENDEK